MVQFKKADRDMIPLIEELAQEIFPATYAPILSSEQIDYMMEWMYSRESLDKQMTEGHVYHIALWDNVPVGYTSVQMEEEGVWHLQKIYLKPVLQGKSVGKQMFLSAVGYIRENSQLPCVVELNVNRNNVKAIRFYEHMGMHKASQGDFPIGNGYFMNDYIMAMDI
jgi:ribosomal protein S18 acetylase RimI-like enzyme